MFVGLHGPQKKCATLDFVVLDYGNIGELRVNLGFSFLDWFPAKMVF